MDKRYSEKVNKYVSKLGFGGWQLGNEEMWGHMSLEEGVELVKEAYKQGITFFDTAPGYSNGLSEKILGEALKDYRDKVFINTKFGHNHLNIEDFSVESIEKSIDGSLERLNTNYVDSVILHNPPRYILEGKSKHEEEFKRLKQIGKIHSFGVSIDSYEELDLVLNNLDIDVIEIMFNINHQKVKELFNKVHEKGILLIVKIPLDSGWLTGKYNTGSKFDGIRSRWSEEDIRIRGEIIEKIKDIVQDENLVKYAISFILSYDEVTTVIPGIKDKNQLKSNIEASNYILEDKIKYKLEMLYEDYIKHKNLPW